MTRTLIPPFNAETAQAKVQAAADAGLTDSLFWGSMAVALATAFVVAFPVNRWLIARGRGHAVAHQHHH